MSHFKFNLTIIAALALFISVSYWRLATPGYITFSDSVRYADAARSQNEGIGSRIHHSYFSSSDINTTTFKPSWEFIDSPATVTFISLAFKLLGASDLTLFIAGSGLFILSALTIYLLGARVFSPSVGLVAAVLFTTNPFFLSYAVNCSSEILFTSEVLISVWLLYLSKPAKFLFILPAVLTLYTRPQGVIFILSLIATGLLVWLIKAIKQPVRLVLLLCGLVILGFFTVYQATRFSIFSHSLFNLKHYGATLIPTDVSPGIYLRGEILPQANISLKVFVTKLFYNTYNFAKNPDRIAPPAVFLFLIMALFISGHNFHWLALITLGMFTLAASATLPNARYIHPVVVLPFISMAAVLENMCTKFKIRYRFFLLALLTLIITLPAFGHIFLDYRFRRVTLNLGRPPVYKVISDILAQNISQGKLTITNLDAWAAWYHGLTTMWFPLSPNRLIPPPGKPNNIDYIVITNYLERDSSFALGEWEEVVYAPYNIQNQFLTDNYRVLDTFIINPEQTYENQRILGTILVKK
ncbi:hypothetical protein A2576_00795 [Candidatus Amesbacteria bacterium RIFOXYD1_FULL_47_9]|uniref:Uncharacterized protein n=1 Tax=Candidatus Amesbacteria bacterium RIFOXYD1_FULL_47_9 TaxID=1797267 RepID=A0A1F5A1D6_9BACT|nr:MAG: hypothetical protein A2576_00795 [Candidatus Amesbacteria bacterium RIFOXYD1_FULL_47_9]